MNYNPKLPDDSVNNEPEGQLVQILISLGIVILGFTILYLAFIHSLKFTLRHLPEGVELSLNDYFNSRSLNSSRYSDEKRRVQNIIDKLKVNTEFSKQNFAITIHSSKEENAYAAPGYSIGVTKGLLDNTESEQELAFVLAHELGHFHNRDHAVGFINGIVNTFIMAVTPESFETITSTMVGVLGLSSQRESEQDADLYALKIMAKTYGEICGWEGFFERANKKEGSLRIYGQYLSTHPLSSKRIEHIRSMIKELNIRDCKFN